MTDLLGPPWPYPCCPQERSIHVLLTAVKSCASNTRRSPACAGLELQARVPSGGDSMGHSLEELGAACQRILTDDPGPEGRKKLCALVQEVLADDAFIATHLGDGVPERKILYEDPRLGFCILAHVYQGARESEPHDHGPSWAIYGQARGETVMSDWAVVEPATEKKPGKVRHVRAYPLKPGMAHVYNEGDVHSPRREGPTRLIRVEGQNMDKVKRLVYEKA